VIFTTTPPRRTTRAPQPRVGGANPRNAREAEARAVYEQGVAAYSAGRFADAATLFDRAYALAERPALLYNIYLSRRDMGDVDAAVVALRRYLTDDATVTAEQRLTLRNRLYAMEETLTARGRTATESAGTTTASATRSTTTTATNEPTTTPATDTTGDAATAAPPATTAMSSGADTASAAATTTDSDDARAERLHAPRIGFSITPDGVGVSASGRF